MSFIVKELKCYYFFSVLIFLLIKVLKLFILLSFFLNKVLLYYIFALKYRLINST